MINIIVLEDEEGTAESEQYVAGGNVATRHSIEENMNPYKGARGREYDTGLPRNAKLEAES